MTAAPGAPLAGRGIVVTRPRAHATGLAEALRAAGAEPFLFPTIEIVPLEDSAALAPLIAGLDGFDLAVFVSETAVAMADAAVRASRAWPKTLRAAAVGPSTARALEAIGFDSVIAPAGRADSEALASLPDMRDLAGKSVVIFRGVGGREWLREVLQARGAAVRYAECYRRIRPPEPQLGPLLARWQRGSIDAVSISSSEGLSNFFGMLGPTGRGYLRATPVFAPHPRIAEDARRLGIGQAFDTLPGDAQTVAGMAAFFAKVSAP